MALIIIDAPHFYAGVVMADGLVVRAAPIIRYMRGWSHEQVKKCCKQKRWQFIEQRIEEGDR